MPLEPASAAPQRWADLVDGTSSQEPSSCETYMKGLVVSVRERLVNFLKSSLAVGGINLKGTLEQQEPLHIDSKGPLQTTKEHWRWEHCKMSLESKTLYEAAGNLFWLSMDKPTWDGQDLPFTGITHAQVTAGRQLWCDGNFLRSSPFDSERGYLMHLDSIPTAVTSIVDVPTKPLVGFRNLPCFSSRAILCGWYSVTDDALRERDTRKILKLYEAALSVPIQLRCAPSRKQVCLDGITGSEYIFSARRACSFSFVDFTQRLLGVMQASSGDHSGGLSRKTIVQESDMLGLTFHAVKVNDNIARCVQKVAPFAQDSGFQVAFKSFENVSLALHDHTKISLILGAVTKYYGKQSEAAVGASIKLLDALRIGVLYDGITASQLTKEFLVGRRRHEGFVKVLLARCAFKELVKCMASTEPPHVEEAHSIWSKMDTVDRFVSEFARRRSKSAAAVGAASGMIDAEDEVEQEEHGLAHATYDAFHEFLKTLRSTPNKLMALIVSKIYCGVFDGEFGLTGGGGDVWCRDWTALLTQPPPPEEEDRLPLLRKACLVWIESMGRASSQVLKPAVELGRESVIANLDVLLRQKLAIIPATQRITEYTACGLMAAVEDVRKSCAQSMTSTSAVGEKNPVAAVRDNAKQHGTLYLCSAELFLGHIVHAAGAFLLSYLV